MNDGEILAQIKREYDLGNEYMRPVRDRYRARLLKWNPQTKVPGKININMIGNAIDTKIAAFWSNGVKVKFISKNGWIGEEEANNLNAAAAFDKKETTQQQLEYQIEQDSEFFGVGICNKVGFDNIKMINTWRAINPLSWIPDPLPTQTGQFDGQNFRFHGFMLRTTLRDMKDRYDNSIVDSYFKAQSESESEQTRQAYSRKNGTGWITCDTLDKNFSTDIYNHMTIINGKKRIFKTDMAFGHIFDRQEILPVTKEEMLDPMLVPRPIMLNFSDPQRDNPLGGSMCDLLEDKQNAKSILANLNVIKAKKEATGGDFLVNSRLIKNKDAFNRKTTDSRYFFIDEEQIGTQPIQNAMYELPQSQIKTDTFAMMNFLDAESVRDSKIDQMQMGIVPDKAMTKAEQQSVQGNANMHISLKNGIKSWYYQEFYFQRWRGYLENMKEGQKKFILMSADYEWTGQTLKKDEFVTKQIPYIMVGSNDDINAINEQQKNYLNALFPLVTADPTMQEVSKNIFKRLVYKINGMQPNMINGIVPYTPSERRAKSYVDDVNLGHMPKTILKNPNLDMFTLWVYMQKANDSELKDKILGVLNKILLDQGLEQQAGAMMQSPMGGEQNPMANSAANIMMSQNAQQNPMNQVTSAQTPNIQPQTQIAAPF